VTCKYCQKSIKLVGIDDHGERYSCPHCGHEWYEKTVPAYASVFMDPFTGAVHERKPLPDIDVDVTILDAEARTKLLDAMLPPIDKLRGPTMADNLRSDGRRAVLKELEEYLEEQFKSLQDKLTMYVDAVTLAENFAARRALVQVLDLVRDKIKKA
jgi:hypothetical protein